MEMDIRYQISDIRDVDVDTIMMIVTGMIMIMIMMIKIIAVVILVTITNMMMITIICDYDYDDNNSDHENNEYDNDNRAQRNLMIIIMIKKCTALMYVSIYISISLLREGRFGPTPKRTYPSHVTRRQPDLFPAIWTVHAHWPVERSNRFAPRWRSANWLTSCPGSLRSSQVGPRLGTQAFYTSDAAHRPIAHPPVWSC